MHHRRNLDTFSIGIGSLRLTILCTILPLLVLVFLPTLLWAFDSRHVLGDAAEGVMQDYFQTGGWKSLPGQVGSQGVDGLFVQSKDGVVSDVLVAESKYGKSRLGKNLVCGSRQMSQSWIVCKLNNLIKAGKQHGSSRDEIRRYEQIKKHVEHGNYRGRLWHAELEGGRLNVAIEDIKGKGKHVELGRLSGPERYKIQSRSIDLKNPGDPFETRISEGYFKNLDKGLQKQGVSQAERAKLMAGFRRNPSNIPQGLGQYALKTGAAKRTVKTGTARKAVVASRKAAKKGVSVATKRVSKGFLKSVMRNLKTGVAGAGLLSWAGPIGVAVGFVGGIAGGMAMDYAMDVAVDTAFASISPDDPEPIDNKPGYGTADGQMVDIENVRITVEKSAAETQTRVGGVGQRMDQQFSDLGEDIDNKHKAEIVAIEDVRTTVERSAAETQARIEAVRERMVEEFSILGQDISENHEAEMAAIGMNMTEILKGQEITLRVDERVGALHTDVNVLGEKMLTGIQSVGVKLGEISSVLASVSSRMDILLNRLDASLKAKYDSGIEAMALFDQTKDTAHLLSALEYFRDFINTFERITPKTSEEDELLLMAKYYRCAAYADLYRETLNDGYALSAVEEFKDISARSANLDFLAMTYLSIAEADVQGEAGAVIFERQKENILQNLLIGEMDQAVTQATALQLILDQDNAQGLLDAVQQYVSTGKDPGGSLRLSDPDYALLMGYVARE